VIAEPAAGPRGAPRLTREPAPRARERAAGVGAILLDVTGTLIEVRGGVERLYVGIAAGHGMRLEPARVGAAFAAALGAAPPLAFRAQSADARQALERRWWRDVVRRTVAESRAASGGAGEVSVGEGGDGPSPAGPAPLDPGARFEAFFGELYAAFARPDAWSVRAGAPDVLAELSGRGYRLGVLSNFDSRLPGLLAGLGLAGHLDVVATSSDLGFAKPDARAFAAALAHMAVPAAAAAYVGDSPGADGAGAAGAGLLPVLLGARLPPHVEGLEIASLADLLDLFQGPDT
jgi:putative hydrolase of the HAD superfamily